MPARGRPWERARAQLLNESRQADAACWICKEAIDYNAAPRTPRSFSADHAQPTSLGGDHVRPANLRPAHYQRVQLITRQHHTRTVPNITRMVRITQGMGVRPPQHLYGWPPGRAPLSPRSRNDRPCGLGRPEVMPK